MVNIKSRVNIQIDLLFPGWMKNKHLSNYLKESLYDINDYNLNYRLWEEIDIDENNAEIIIFSEEINDSNIEIKSKGLNLEEVINKTDDTKKSEWMELKDEVVVEEINIQTRWLKLS